MRFTDDRAPNLRRLAWVARLACSAVFLVGSASLPLAAQDQTPEWIPLLARADSMVNQGDSTAALELLQKIVHSDRNAAPAWYRLGSIAWRLAQPDSSVKVDWNPNTISWMRQADSSLKMAARLEPDSARYQLTVGNFLLAGDISLVRFQAMSFFKKAVDAAERSGDSLTLSESLDRTGMRYWRRYEPMAHRWMTSQNMHPDVARFADNLKELDNFLETQAWQMEPEPGEADYLTATDYFGRALDANSQNTTARRHFFMSLLAKEQWTRVRDAAQQRTVDVPWDVWGWLALGLAEHRLDQDGKSTVAYDTALALMSRTERDFFTRLSRLLAEDDSANYDSMDQKGKISTERMFWMLADPMALTPGNESWLEFLSRVTYAELMWTVEEYGIRGADTERGEIYIRYGPPDRLMAFPSEDRVSTQVIWIYQNGMVFFFTIAPGFGTATPSFDAQHLRDVFMNDYPSNFNNLGVFSSIDSIPLQMARFREGPDSTGLWLAAEIPANSLAKGVELTSGLLQTAVLVFDGRARVLQVDTSNARISFENVPNRRSSWRFALPAEELGYRVEALQKESNHAARAVGAMDLRHPEGFGMSDVLLSARAEPAAGGAVLRWTDLVITPSLSTVREGNDVSLVWETYDLAADSTSSSAYTVTIALTRTDGSKLLRGIASVIEGTLGRGDGRRSNNQVSVSFDRRVPARPVTLDYLRLALRDLNPGEYQLTITIKDRISGKETSGSRDLTIAK